MWFHICYAGACRRDPITVKQQSTSALLFHTKSICYKIPPFSGPGVEIEDVTEEMEKKGADDTGPVSKIIKIRQLPVTMTQVNSWRYTQ